MHTHGVVLKWFPGVTLGYCIFYHSTFPLEFSVCTSFREPCAFVFVCARMLQFCVRIVMHLRAHKFQTYKNKIAHKTCEARK